MKIYVYSHGFVVSTIDRRVKFIIAGFIRARLSVENFKIGKKDPGRKVYAFADATKTQTYFLISLLDDFLLTLTSNGIREKDYDLIIKKPPKGERVDIKFIAPYKMTELQNRCLEFIREDRVASVAPLQTGKGKTALALYFMCEYGRRTLISMNAKYIPRWLQDLTGESAVVDLKSEDLLVINGLIKLKKYIDLMRLGQLEFKVIIVSNTTLHDFYKEFAEKPKEWKRFGFKTPFDLFTFFKIGFRIRDEAHEDLHFNCRFDVFTNVSKSLDLSATLLFDDPQKEAIAQKAFPLTSRFDQGKWDTYTDVCCVLYRLSLPTKIKWTMGFNGPYNHAEFEKSILKSTLYTNSFKVMVEELVEELFLRNMSEGWRCLVYATTKDMCTVLSAYLGDCFNLLNVNRYIGEDEYGELLSGDIVVTTPKSAGTGVDIPGLMVIIDLSNVSSTQAILQRIGRCRKPKTVNEDGTIDSPKYYYTTCVNIPQHMKYHMEKRSKLLGFVKSQTVYDSVHKL